MPTIEVVTWRRRASIHATGEADGRAQVVSRKTKLVAAALAGPFVVLVVAGLIISGGEALPGFAFFTGLVIIPIGAAVWMGVGAGRQTDQRLKRRDRPFPRTPQQLATVEDPNFELASIDLPLFSRPLATLWTRVAVVGYEGRSLKMFDVIHADMFGEGSVSRTALAETGTPGVASGMSLVTCALALVDADMPLIVVRPRYEKPFTLPTQLREYDTELDEFNRGFRLFSEDAYAATAIVDQRTIDAIRGFDPGTAIEIGGRAVLMYSSRRDSSLRLIQQAANLARTFPSVVTSLFPVLRRTTVELHSTD